MQKIKKLPFAVRILLIAMVTLTIIALSFAVYKNRGKEPRQVTQTNGNNINLDGPTDDEKKSGDNVKPSIVAKEDVRNQTPTQTPSGKRSVTPTITYAEQHDNQVEVGAYINGVFEDGGKCTLTLQKGTLNQTTDVTGVKGSNNVNCPVMIIDTAKLGAGTWQAVVSYSSPTSEGKSSSRSIEVN